MLDTKIGAPFGRPAATVFSAVEALTGISRRGHGGQSLTPIRPGANSDVLVALAPLLVNQGSLVFVVDPGGRPGWQGPGPQAGQQRLSCGRV
jgi:hypothetical protein